MLLVLTITILLTLNLIASVYIYRRTESLERKLEKNEKTRRRNHPRLRRNIPVRDERESTDERARRARRARRTDRWRDEPYVHRRLSTLPAKPMYLQDEGY
jgi:hypothetical protein